MLESLLNVIECGSNLMKLKTLDACKEDDESLLEEVDNKVNKK